MQASGSLADAHRAAFVCPIQLFQFLLPLCFAFSDVVKANLILDAT